MEKDKGKTEAEWLDDIWVYFHNGVAAPDATLRFSCPQAHDFRLCMISHVESCHSEANLGS